MDVAADTLVGDQQTLVDFGPDFLGLRPELGDLRRGLGLDTLQLALLGFQVGGPLAAERLGLLQEHLLALDAGGILLEPLVSQFDFQLLVFDFLGDGVELAVVADVVLLLLVVGNHDFGLVGLALTLLDQGVELLDFGVDLVDAGPHARHLVLEVLHLQRQIALDFVDLVDPAVDTLQLVERQNLLLHRVIGLGGLLLCSHMMS